MTTYDIIAHPEQYHLVQFCLDNNGYMHPLHSTEFKLFVSDKYPDHPFASPRASKYGVRRILGATHWAIVRFTDDNTELLHHGTLASIERKKRIIPFNHNTSYCIISRGSRFYFSMMIAREAYMTTIQPTIQELSS